MTAAAKVIEVGHSSMSAEEKKRFDALTPRKRNYDGGYKGQNYNSFNAIMNGRNEGLFTKEEFAKMLLGNNGGGGGGKQIRPPGPSAGTARGWAIGRRTVRSPGRPRSRSRSLSLHD